MQITGLPQTGNFTGTDVLAIEINGVTYKLDGATLATAIASIGSLVTGVKGNNEDTYRTGNVNITPENIGAYSQADTDSAIQQSTADEAKSYDITGTTWADVYSTLSKLAAGRPAVVSIAGGTASLMTNNKIAYACTGIAKVANPTTGVYEFMVMSNISQYIYTWRITGLTSASSTPTISTVYRFSGVAV